MANLIVSAMARADLATIQQYLREEAGTATAQHYAAQFADTIEGLKTCPGIGAPRPSLGDNTRIVMVLPYLIFYDYDAVFDRIVVVRVLHGRRNITEQLLQRS